MTSGLITHLIATYGYFAVFALIALESLGIPLPGETALITASIYAGSTHRLDISAIAAVAAAAAIIGDNAGYQLGRRGGGALVARYGYIVRLDQRKLRVGRYLFARHGGSVVFFGRFISVLRTYAAFLAGLNRMPMGRFTVANATGGVIWAAGYAAGAFAIGSAAASLGSLVTLVGLGVTTVLTVVGTLMLRGRMARLEERADAMFPKALPEPRPRREVVGRCR